VEKYQGITPGIGTGFGLRKKGVLFFSFFGNDCQKYRALSDYFSGKKIATLESGSCIFYPSYSQLNDIQ